MSARTPERSSRLIVLAVLLAIAACRHAPAPPKLAVLDGQFEPLRALFNADASHVRVLALLSPT